ncbi:MAG: cupin domain-containing protein [Pseudomonadota bacterium]
MPKVDLDSLPTFDGPAAVSRYGGDLGHYIGRAVSDHHGMTHLGANIETLSPGARSSHQHWHDTNDELVVILSGALYVLEEGAETPLAAGDVAVFPAGVANGHCLENRSALPATFLAVGTRLPNDTCHYPDLDLILKPDGSLARRDGSPPE